MDHHGTERGGRRAGAERRGRIPRWQTIVLVVSAVLLPVIAYGVWKPRHRGDARPVAARTSNPPRPAEPLPYVNYVPIKDEHKGKSGTVVHVRGRAAPGYNLYVAKPSHVAKLVDMDGELVHTWSSTEAQPDPSRPVPADMSGWQTVRMAPNGDLYAIVGRAALLKLDWSSKILWKAPEPVHHEVKFADDGNVYALTERLRFVTLGDRQRLIADHGVVILSAADGAVKKSMSLYDVFSKDDVLRPLMAEVAARRFAQMDRAGIAALVAKGLKQVEDDDISDLGFKKFTLERPGSVERMKALYETGACDVSEYERLMYMRATPFVPSDMFHANAITVLKRHPAGLWKDGDLMISVRRYDLIVVIDPESERVVWTWGPGPFQGQHTPVALPNGHLLVYDNGRSGYDNALSRRHSRIVELDPAAKAEVWAYEAAPPEAFYSKAEGSCQDLPNGNVLVADALSGRAFEATREREIVWEYFNPVRDDSGTRRSGIYRIERLAPEVVEPLLRRGAAAP